MQIAQARYADYLEARRFAGRWQLVAYFAGHAVIVQNARGGERSWASLDTLVRHLARTAFGQKLHVDMQGYQQETML